jgi:hypothetical protein
MEDQSILNQFDSIRPFYNSEVQDAIQRLLLEPSFHAALMYVFPEVSPEMVAEKLRGIHSVEAFQEEIVSHAVSTIIRSSTSGVRTKGLDELNKDQPYLFISNHRDIVLDSAFLNYLLFSDGFPTTRIAIGSNLLQKPWIEDLVKLNKNFIVQRDVQPREAYQISLILSNYIRHSIVQDHSSVWIAQKEGRSKNGIDRTQVGLLKMLGMSGEQDASGFEALSILPVSISYEFEPCAGMKAWEKYNFELNGVYTKQPGEDLASMKSGIAYPKGRVQFSFGRNLSRAEINSACEGNSRNDAMKQIAYLIDAQIIANYRLYPFNYLAFDLETNTSTYATYYTEKDRVAFEQHKIQQLTPLKAPIEELSRHFLAIYSNPIKSKLELNLSV